MEIPLGLTVVIIIHLPMLSLPTENQLAQLLLRIASGERDVELSRQSLSEHYAFDPYTAFRSLDRLGLGNLSSIDVKDWLDRAGHYCSEQEAYLLIKQYDANNDGRLSLNEFLQLVLPSTSTALRQLALDRASSPLSLDVEYALNRLLDKEVRLQRELEYSRRDLRMRYDWDLLAAFRAVDRLGLSYIDRLQLRDFLERNGLSAYQDDIDAILRRLDIDADERLSYTEFVEAVLPSQPRGASLTTRDFSYSSPRRSLSRSSLRSSLGASSPSRASLRASSPLRSSPSRLSALRASSPTRLSASRSSALRSSSPLRESTRLRASASPSRITTPLKSSAARRLSPEKETRLTPSRSLTSSVRSSLSHSLHEYDEVELVSTFQEQINLARELEEAKIDLALRSDFVLEDAFGMFDLEDLGYVTTLEVEETFRSFGLSFLVDEVRLFIKHFSQHSGTRLNFQEFSEALLPQSSEYARMIRSRLPFNAVPEDRRRVFDVETQVRLNRVLRIHLDSERVAESLRQRLSRIPSFNLYDAFKVVDKSNDGVITLDEFRSILQDHGLYATTKDLESLMDRYDKDRDGRVSYSEFVQEVRPKSPRKY